MPLAKKLALIIPTRKSTSTLQLLVDIVKIHFLGNYLLIVSFFYRRFISESFIDSTVEDDDTDSSIMDFIMLTDHLHQH